MTDQRTHPFDAPPWTPERPALQPTRAWTPTGDRTAAPPVSPPLAPPSSPATSSGSPIGPSGAGPVGGPGGTGPRRRGRAGAAAVLLAASMTAAAGGVVVGRNLVDEPSVSSSVTPAASVTTVAGPVASGATEPVAAVAAAVAPAVVQIETTQGLGSGFIYDASGLILTAGHVVDGARQVQVRLADGTRVTGTVVGSDASTDVAVVRIPRRAGLPVAKLATGVPLQVGQMAVAIGSPFGLDQTVTAGIVSAVGRSTETPGGVIPAVQTDAPINSGNSGGALVDRQGRIIGINDSIITGNSSNSGNVGVGFAIPIDIAKVVADKLVAGQSTEAGYLGVAGADATGDRAGAALTQVESGSPAAKAGLTTDDVVVEAAGRKVASMIDLAAAIRTNEPGQTIRLKVLRNGRERTVDVTLTTAPG